MMEGFCDECGMLAKGSVSLETGHVLKDGKDFGQLVNLCEKHWPSPGLCQQPTDCKHISFRWPGVNDTNP